MSSNNIETIIFQYKQLLIFIIMLGNSFMDIYKHSTLSQVPHINFFGIYQSVVTFSVSAFILFPNSIRKSCISPIRPQLEGIPRALLPLFSA